MIVMQKEAYVLLVSSVPLHLSSEGPGLVLPSALSLTKGYLGVVGAHGATAAPGAVRGTVRGGWKQVMPLLLRPRSHEIHHRAVPGRQTRWDVLGGERKSHSATSLLGELAE